MTEEPRNPNEPKEPSVKDPGESRTKAPRRLTWFLFLRLLAATGLVAYLVQRSGPAQLWESLPRMRWTSLLEAVLLYAALQALSAYKWGLILRSQRGEENLPTPPYPRLVTFYFMAMFTNLFFPSNIGGDTLRAVMVAPYANGIARGALSILMERATGFVALIAIGLTASLTLSLHPSLLHVRSDLSFQGGNLLLIMGACACIVFFGTTIVFRRLILAGRIPRWTPRRVRLLLQSFAECIENFGSNASFFAYIIFVSLLFQLGYVVLNQSLMESANIHLPFVYLCFFAPVTTIMVFIPLAPNGFGVRELTVTTLLASLGIPSHDALLFCVASYVVTVMASLPGAVGMMALRPDLKKIRKRNGV